MCSTMKCKCGDIKKGSVFRGNILGEWSLNCPVCNLEQVFNFSEIFNSKEWPGITQGSDEVTNTRG